jgi:hypothetical protein
MTQANPTANNYLHQTIKDMQQALVNLQTQPPPNAFGFYYGSSYVSLNVSTVTETVLVGSPEVYASIGSSGDALITMSAYMEYVTANNSALMILAIDGVATAGTLVFGGSAATAFASCSTTVQLSGLSPSAVQTPGTHLFSYLYASGVNSENAFFNNICLQVQPL